ncbi:MAG: Hsp70 family protein [Acidimicrobiales bacterium]
MVGPPPGAAAGGHEQAVSPVGFLPEPSAAAVHYHERARMEPGATIGVYDLGGGTFDATVIRRSETGYEILGRPTGLDQLGGLDFDQVVFDLVMETMPSVFDELDPDDVGVQRAVARLRECTRARSACPSTPEPRCPSCCLA